MKNIDLYALENITGGQTASTSRGSSTTLQTALTGVTSALDSLKQNQNKNGSLEQMLPILLMARWSQNR